MKTKTHPGLAAAAAALAAILALPQIAAAGKRGTTDHPCDPGPTRPVSVHATPSKVKIGTVNCWDSHQGYGYITPHDGGAEPMVHFSAIVQPGVKSLGVGQRVAYEPYQGPKFYGAEKVRMATAPEAAALRPYLDPDVFRLAQCRERIGKDYAKLPKNVADFTGKVFRSQEDTRMWRDASAQYTKSVQELKSPDLTPVRCEAVLAQFGPLSRTVASLVPKAMERPGQR